MSVSIYYSFRTRESLETAGVLKAIEGAWDKAFDGEPYESWCWYDTTKEKKFLRPAVYTYSGATALPTSDEVAMRSVIIATKLLSNLRNKVGGFSWSVNLDDLEIPWDESLNGFSLK